MSFLTRYKTPLIVLIVSVILYAGYSFLFSDTSELFVAEEITTQTPVEQELLALLLELRGINLDLSIFSNSVFQALQDFSQEVVPEPTGRENPFGVFE